MINYPSKYEGFRRDISVHFIKFFISFHNIWVHPTNSTAYEWRPKVCHRPCTVWRRIWRNAYYFRPNLLHPSHICYPFIWLSFNKPYDVMTSHSEFNKLSWKPCKGWKTWAITLNVREAYNMSEIIGLIVDLVLEWTPF